MESVIIYTYLTAVGFVMAGVLSSFVQLVSGEPMRFGLQTSSMLSSLGGVLLRVFAGPAILMRNGLAGNVDRVAAEGLVRACRARCRLVEPFHRRVFDRSGSPALGASPPKKEPISCETGSSKGPVGSGMGGGGSPGLERTLLSCSKQTPQPAVPGWAAGARSTPADCAPTAA